MPMNNFKVGEMLNKRSPFSKTWMNFDGSYTTEIHSGQIHFNDETGNMHNINTDLVDEADFDQYNEAVSRHGKAMFDYEKEKVKGQKKKDALNRDAFDYQAPTVPFSVQIPKNIKKGYSMGENNDFVRFIPFNASPSKGYISKDKKNEIHYQDVWNDTDVLLEVTDRGIKETMILKTDRAPFAFSFEVEGVIEDDLTMGNMKLEPAWLIDAVGEKRDVSQTIRREGETTYIDLVADVEGLVYPIEIDPTVIIQHDGTAGKDTYVRDALPTTPNGGETTLYFGVASSSTNKFRALVQFDLSGIVGSVTNANLQLNVMSGGSGIANPVIKRVTQSWDEATVNWNTQPTFENVIQGEYGPSSANSGLINFSITNLVKSWVDGVNLNYGMMIMEKVETTTESYLTTHSSDSTTASSRPKLEITYNQPPTAPTVTTPNGGETWNSLHMVEWVPSEDYTEKTINVAYGTTGSWGNFNTIGQRVGQTYTVQNTGKLGKVRFYSPTTTGIVDIELRVKDVVGGLPGSTVYATKRQTFNFGAGSTYFEFVLDNPPNVTSGQVVAFEIYLYGYTTNSFGLSIVTSNPYAGGNAFLDTATQTHDVKMDIFELAIPVSSGGALIIQPSTQQSSYASGMDEVGQVFTLTSGGYVKKISMFNGGADNPINGIKIELTGESLGGSNGVVLASKTNPTRNGNYAEYVLPTPYKVPVGGKVVVRLVKVTSGVSLIGQSENVYPNNGSYFVSGGTVSKYNYATNSKLEYDEATPQNALQYQIQLSTDNGVNWSDIVTLTAAGATSYIYDFINTAETSTAKIRIRAYDGSAYGPWDESDGVFTIVHNQAPNAPTNLSPASGVKDRESVTRFTWVHNDPNGTDPQSKFDLQYRLQGAGTWTTITQTTTNNYYDIAANTLPLGVIEWQVRTYDQAGLSGPYSAVSAFSVANKPAPATFVTPADGAVISVPKPLIQWSHPSQTDYHVKVLDATGTTTIWEQQRTSTNKAVTVGINLENETAYQIQVSVKDSGGLWSAWTVSNVTVSFTPPPLPVLSTTKDDVTGFITLSIENPTPTGTEPILSYNDVFRRENGGVWVQLAAGVAPNGSFIDYQPKPGATIEYYVTAYGENGTVRDSGITSQSVTVYQTQLLLPSDPSKNVTMKRGTTLSKTNRIESEKMHFAGRSYALTEFGEQKEQAFDYTYIVSDYTDIQMIEYLIDAGEALLLRDNIGRKEYVSIDEVSIEEGPIYWVVSIQPQKVYYVEGV